MCDRCCDFACEDVLKTFSRPRIRDRQKRFLPDLPASRRRFLSLRQSADQPWHNDHNSFAVVTPSEGDDVTLASAKGGQGIVSATIEDFPQLLPQGEHFPDHIQLGFADPIQTYEIPD